MTIGNQWYIINGEASTVTGSFTSNSNFTSSAGTGMIVQSVSNSAYTQDTAISDALDEKLNPGRGKKKVKGEKEKSLTKVPVARKSFSPKIYFRFVKSKLTEVQQETLRSELNKLKPFLIAAKESGQQALYEKLSVHAAVIVKEQEALAIGCGTRLDKKTIDKFINKVQDRVVKLDLLMNFPRPIPAKIRKKISEVRETRVFDSYHILYVDYTEEEAPKTMAKKVREKDPILFGSFNFQPGVFYFIVDWVDLYCDLTLSKVVDSIQHDDPEYELDKVPEVSEAYFNEIVKQVNRSHNRLKNTNSKNWEELEAQELAEQELADKKLKEADEKMGEVSHFFERVECMVKNFKKKILGSTDETEVTKK
jgi:hypothetical protein